MTLLGTNTLRELADFRALNACAVSLYLDLDPHVAPTPAELGKHLDALFSEAGRVGRVEGDGLTHEERLSLRLDLERISRYFDEEFVRNGARGLALFSCDAGNLWRVLPLSQSVPSTLKIARRLFLSPLVPVAEDSGDVVVVAVGREQGQILLLRDGSLELLADHFEQQPRRHDQGGRAQTRYARHIEQLVHEHLREVAADLDRRLRRLHPLGLVVVTTEETRSEIERLLSSEARRLLVGFAQPGSRRGAPALQKVVQPLVERLHEEREARLTRRWQEEFGRGARACAGWECTLEAASDGRIDVLLYRAGVESTAWLCGDCERISVRPGNCSLDGTTLVEQSEGLDLLVHRTLEQAGSIVALREPSLLDENEGIGALLRF